MSETSQRRPFITSVAHLLPPLLRAAMGQVRFIRRRLTFLPVVAAFFQWAAAPCAKGLDAANLLMVLELRLKLRATSICVSPAASRCSASWRWCGVSLRGLPNFTPRSLARLRPSPVRATISERSNSASPPSTVSISRPCGVEVSYHASCSDLKPVEIGELPFEGRKAERGRRPRG